MKTVLVVEDEKMIRQGIKTMIQRSGVPVEVILECNNGETALEIIKEQAIDVMFTDIRMPRMDGIQLVKEMQSCEHIPLTVAISGYDDFSYAVEMLRSGVREYILKPVEREKITEILQKLDTEIEERNEQHANYKKLGFHQMKHLMLSAEVTEEEIQAVEKQYDDYFYQMDYVVCCRNAGKANEYGKGNYFFIDNVGDCDVLIMPFEYATEFLQEDYNGGYIGFSNRHQGIRELREAYLEAFEMRKNAFLRNRTIVMYDGKKDRIPEGLLAEAAKLLTSSAKLQRVQLLGTAHTDELEKCWKQFFYEVKNGRIKGEDFEDYMQDFFEEVNRTYQGSLEHCREIYEECRNIWKEQCIDTYEEKVMEFVMQLHDTINHQFDVNENTKKMKMAVEYIDKHYAGDLNMAVVSNHISMNYSLFSYSFKQYTGSNFVNYLKEIRMKEAKRLLAETDKRIIDISQEVGYDNEKHFMKIFKATCGVSPTEYRKNMKRVI